jgi:hypothetical protein
MAGRHGAAVCVPQRVGTTSEAVPATDIDSLLRQGWRALSVDGDLRAARERFDAAYQAAEAAGDPVAAGEAVLARTRLAQALDRRGGPVDAGRAGREWQIAAREAAGPGLPAPAPRADRTEPEGACRPQPGSGTRTGPGSGVHRGSEDAPRTGSTRAAPEPVTCRRRGHQWEIGRGCASVLIRQGRGIQHLAVLIANPGQEIRAVELAAGPGRTGDGPAPDGRTSAQPVLDDVAKRQYRARLERLTEDIEGYEARGDAGRAQRLRAERDWLLAELATAAGLGGRTRAFADNDERARIAVGKAIRRTLDQVARADPMLGAHLRDAVRTGSRCSYLPH